MQLLFDTLVLAVIGTVCGFAVNAASPRPVTLAVPVMSAAESGEGSCSEPLASDTVLQRISIRDATAACDACSAAFVDARSAREFEEGHITGAVHLPPKGHADEAATLQTLAASPTVIVYDGDSSCRLAEGVARRLLSAGISNVRILEGAWPGWIAAGGPGASGVCAECGNEGDTTNKSLPIPDEETR